MVTKIKMPRHPAWKLAELATVGLILVAIFGLGLVYKSPIELKDLIPIVSALLTITGFSIAKANLTDGG